MVISLIVALLLVVLAEFIHFRRCARLRSLLFHNCRLPRPILITLAMVRVAGFALVAIGTAKLWSDSLFPAALNSAFDTEETDRLLIVLDCSLSMDLRDAGPGRDISRGERAADLIRDLLLGEGRTLPRSTLVVFADRATPLIVDTNDWNVIRHSLNNRSLSKSLFANKQTTIGSVLRNVFQNFAEKWPHHSTSLLLITDGDSNDPVGTLALPRSIRRTVVVGVGSAEGKLIGDFQSRQDERTLQSIAQSLGGRYFNCNESPIPAEALGRVPPPPEAIPGESEADASVPLGERSLGTLSLLGSGSMLLIAAILAGLFLDPSRMTSSSYEPSKFLS